MEGNVLKVLKHLSRTLFQFFKTLIQILELYAEFQVCMQRHWLLMVSQLICSFLDEYATSPSELTPLR